MEFEAEIKRTNQSKRNLDNIYQITFETDNPLILDLGKLPSDKTVMVKVELQNE